VTTIALCMIVKNEAPIIARCLASLRSLIDYVLIVDTGSTDGTQDVVRRWLDEAGVPGEVVDEPWRDFAYNRTFALAKLRERPGLDYSLMIDADQVVEFDESFDVETFKASLDCDLYDVKVSTASIVYLLPQLASNAIEIVYRGILHEYRECPEGCSREPAQGLLIKELHDSARGQDPRKYEKDASILETALAGETDPFLIARYRFYLAQSYRDAGLLEPAIANYVERAKLGGWDEEVFYCLYAVAKMKEQLGHPNDDVFEAYHKAHRFCPSRAEPIYAAAQFCRKQKRYDQGYRMARKHLYQPAPSSGLFVETWIYDHGLLDEFSVLAFWSGRYSECLDACMRILGGGKLPESEHARVRQNAHFAIDKLGTTLVSEQLPDGEASTLPRSAEPPGPTPGSFASAGAAISRPPVATSRYAIVTPYYREDRKTLERCLDSVRKQSVHVDHIVVADGFPQSWIDDEPVRHIKLDTAHADFGNTPRGLGALLAVSEGYAGIGLLDADNWLAPDHVANCAELAARQKQQCDFIIARRHLMTPEEVLLGVKDEPSSSFVDTSCYFYLPGSYPALHHWVTMPKPLAPVCDRIFFATADAYRLRSAELDQPTVFYETLWAAVYEAARLPVPPNAKPNVDMTPTQIWLDSLSAEELRLTNKLAGSVVRDPEKIAMPTPRNAKCPCGSGKRYKHCHGAIVA
jgi:glycosyltransferase involved in cell wall biosynthesis